MNNRYKFTLQERIFFVTSYLRTNADYDTMFTEFQQQFPNSPLPNRTTVWKTYQKFLRTGSVADAPRFGLPVSVTTNENMGTVALALVEQPNQSAVRLSGELQISDRSLRRMLKRMHYRVYRPRLVHALHEDDFDRRLEFCEWYLGCSQDDRRFQHSILWSDEATFKLNGTVNRHNCVYWNDQNPHVFMEKELNLPGVCVWAGIHAGGLVGICNTLKGEFTQIVFETMYGQRNEICCIMRCVCGTSHKILKAPRKENLAPRWVFGNFHNHLLIHLNESYPALKNTHTKGKWNQHNRLTRYLKRCIIDSKKEDVVNSVVNLHATYDTNPKESDNVNPTCSVEECPTVITSPTKAKLVNASKINIVSNIVIREANKGNYKDSSITNKYIQSNQNSSQHLNAEDCTSYVQDTVHIATKLRTRLLNSKVTLKIGNFSATSKHLVQVIAEHSKDKHLLTTTDLKLEDKMNYKAAETYVQVT
ncbi:hypothetical protein FQR65_LT14568 [Abscondita terminalis]|nr:hypothetical protein FQR65_LT14568 [Abscondita terminalis]